MFSALEDESVVEEKDEIKPIHEKRASQIVKAKKAGEIKPMKKRDDAGTTDRENLVSGTVSTTKEAETASQGSETTPLEVERILSKEQDTTPKVENTPSVDDSTSPDEGSETGAEPIQMRAAAKSIINVLDIIMPDTLSDEKKEKVNFVL